MHIIIPMSGQGSRFVAAGYTDPKPLIKVDGKPIIEHVVNLFPGEKKFTFICNEEHLAATNMRAELERIAPGCTIVSVKPEKLGPVYHVAHIFDQIADDEEVIVNYCDFGKSWDYAGFLQHTRNRNADAAMTAYRGFHPHMLGSTNYAFMREHDQWMDEIQEKKPFTDNRMEEFAGDGTFYFRTGAIVKKYFQEVMDKKIDLNGEYYVSLVFNLLKADGLKISIYEITQMLQWGEPADLEDYQAWSDYFASLVTPKQSMQPESGSLNLIPLAGRGSRFADQGYVDPKPLIEVSGKPMIVQAANSVAPAENWSFVCLQDHLDRYPLKEAITNEYPNADITSVAETTEGQACTCELGLKNSDPEKPLLIAPCDNGMGWDTEKYAALIADPSIDAIVWTFRHHPSSVHNPQMYGWIMVEGDSDVATGVSVKKAISDDPFNDHAVVGTFYFRKAQYFLDAHQELHDKDIRVNNEFYVDSCVAPLIEKGLNVRVFEIDHYICWGTPDDLRTFEYWQRFFNDCDWHPYEISKDGSMNQERAAALEDRYSALTPKQIS